MTTHIEHKRVLAERDDSTIMPTESGALPGSDASGSNITAILNDKEVDR